MGAIAASPAGIRAGVPIAAGLGLLAATIAAGVFGALAGEATSTVPTAIAGIPAEYLAAYEESAQRFELGADGWSYLAGIGKVESRPWAVHRSGRAFGPERVRLLRRPDADPQRLRLRRRDLGRVP